MTVGLDLQLIGLAVPIVHDLAHNPARAIANHVIAENEFTRPWLTHPRYSSAAQPGLRRATGYIDPGTPIRLAKRSPADRDTDTLARLYRRIAKVLRHCAVTSPAGPADPAPHLLVSLAGQLHRRACRGSLTDAMAARLHDLAVELRPLLLPAPPDKPGPVCRNPRRRDRCTGLPLHDRTLQVCTSCYQHEAYRARKHRPSLLVDTTDDSRVVSTTESHSGRQSAHTPTAHASDRTPTTTPTTPATPATQPAAPPAWQTPTKTKPTATVWTTCATCDAGYTTAWINGRQEHLDCDTCRAAA